MERFGWSQFRQGVADLTMPAQCVNCGAWGSWLCRDCETRVVGRLAHRDVAIGGMAGATLAVSSAMPYSGTGKRVVLAHKQLGLRPLAHVMAAWLVTAIESVVQQPGPTCLIPVPASARSRRKRGRDPWLEVCLTASDSLGPDFRVATVLAWQTRVRPQKNLSRRDRAENVAHKMVARPGQSEHPLSSGAASSALILVDDVVTTGTTLGECARALHEAGMVCSGAATVCAVTGQ